MPPDHADAKSTEIARRPGRSHPPSLVRLAERLIRDEQLIERGDTVLCACSGGPDSTALLSVLGRLRSRFGFTLVAHGVDHGLRAEARAELSCAERLCDALRVPFAITRVQVEPGGNVQARARDARRGALRDAARIAGARLLATGHTADDRAETFLLRLLRGAGPRGLAVLPPSAPLPDDAGWETRSNATSGDASAARERSVSAQVGLDKATTAPADPQKTSTTAAHHLAAKPALSRTGEPPITLIRPLLLARRADVEAHLARHGIEAARDPSNDDARFLRVRVRRELLPLMEQLAPGTAEHLCALADMLAAPPDEEALSGVKLDDLGLEGLGRAQRLALARAKKCERPVKLLLRGGREVVVGFSSGKAVLMEGSRPPGPQRASK